MTKPSRIVSVGILSAFFLLPAVGSASSAAPADSQVFMVQGLPGESVSVSVDGGTERELAAGTVSDGVTLASGEHVLSFTGKDTAWRMDVDVDLRAGGSTDVVIHRPASPDGDPIVTTFENPRAPVTSDRGRVQVAHTATVPPADIVVDGDVVFANVANGEFATAEVPAGVHDVSIVPTGQTGPALLGPVDLEVEPATLTRVYAIGQPEGNSMNVVVATLPLSTNGSQAPEQVNTGSAGLVSDRSASADSWTLGWAAALVPVVAGLTIGATLLVRRTRTVVTSQETTVGNRYRRV